ncbi:MAG: hypothetical protein RJA81_2039 [Planctomycetota bacterium]|jgi:hypothetical protein
MKIDQFLKHHGIASNPFSEEDAQTDLVFKRKCLEHVHHPEWDKFLGSPLEPSTAVVFGEKGSGKTALRLQATARIDEHNRDHSDLRVFLIQYDDFNPFLDHFKTATSAASTDAALNQWKLHDHMDAILSLGVTQLVDELSDPRNKAELTSLRPDQRRDLLLLATIYDASTKEPIQNRWNRLRRWSGFRPLWSRRDLQIGFGMTLVVFLLIYLIPALRSWNVLPWMILPLATGWVYWTWRFARAEWYASGIRRAVRVLSRDSSALRWELVWFEPSDLGGQPLPTVGSKSGSGEERFELLRKFQGVLTALQYHGVIVLVDRVDEPQQVEGDPRRMRALVWPLLDHKFLRHPGIGFKLLLPIELAYFLDKEEKEFYDKARPDKLNLIKPLRWTGASLYDLATDRLRACALSDAEGNLQKPRLRDLVDDSVDDETLQDALSHVRTPRHLFKFLHRLIQEHCQKHTEDKPVWKVESDTFRRVFDGYMRDLDAFDRGYGHG